MVRAMRVLLVALVLAGCAARTEPYCVEAEPTCDGDDGALCLGPEIPGDACVAHRVLGAPECDADGELGCRMGSPACVSPEQFDSCE